MTENDPTFRTLSGDVYSPRAKISQLHIIYSSRKSLSCRLPSSQNVKRNEKVVTGYIWRYAREQGASLFFRGVRTWTVDGREERQLQILNSWGPLLLGRIWPLRTIFLEGDPRYRNVSSTRTRKICDDVRRIRRGCGEGGAKNDDDDDDELSRSVDELMTLVPRCVVDGIVEAYGTDA